MAVRTGVGLITRGMLLSFGWLLGRALWRWGWRVVIALAALLFACVAEHDEVPCGRACRPQVEYASPLPVSAELQHSSFGAARVCLRPAVNSQPNHERGEECGQPDTRSAWDQAPVRRRHMAVRSGEGETRA
jgi:hypothetical protein